MIIDYLNTLALELSYTSEAAFYFHYWGKISDHKTHPLHKHSFFECCYVTNGEGIYIENDRSYPLYPGDCFLSRPGIWHRIESTNGIGLVWVAFSMVEELSSSQYTGKYRRLLSTDRIWINSGTPSLTAAIWQMLIKIEQAEGIDSHLLKHIVFSLILSFFQSFLDEMEYKKPYSKPNESVTMRKAKLFIHDNIALRIKFKDLAEYLHISERQLSRLFKDELEESFSDYYRRVKIQTATALMQSTDLSLEQISMDAGFYSIHHFSKAFKQHTGTPPGVWRKKLQTH